MTAERAATTTYFIDAPAGETLAALESSGQWEAWRGAIVVLSAMDASRAAAKAGLTAADIDLDCDQCESDYAGLATSCRRTAEYLARWIDRHLGGAKDYSGGHRPSDVRTLADGRYLATYHIYPGAF